MCRLAHLLLLSLSPEAKLDSEEVSEDEVLLAHHMLFPCRET